MNLDDEVIFNKAIKLQNNNRHRNALKILFSLERKYSKFSPLYGLIASSFYQIGDFKNSAKYFKKTLKLNPDSELASLGLFHSLKEMGKLKSAFGEMDRFLNLNKSNLYKTTILEMIENISTYTKRYQQDIIKKYS